MLGMLMLGLLLAAAGHVQAQGDWTYTSRPGDTLWELSQRYLEGTHLTERLRAYNGIQDPARIRPGTRIRVPVRWLKVQPATATLVEKQGQVLLTRTLPTVGSMAVSVRNESRREAQIGERLEIGHRLQTGPSASATVRFADGSTLFLHADSELVFDSLSEFSDTGMVDTRLRLNRGRLENKASPAKGAASRFEISTPAAVAAVRGTEYRVVSDVEQRLTRGEVTEGEIVVSASGRSRRVPQGFGVIAAQGQRPQPPRRLLPAVDLSAVAETQTRLVLDLSWPAIDGAVRYRLLLYADEARSSLLDERLTREPGARLETPPDGRYWLRVRAIDASGLEGLDADRMLLVDARPVPPVVLKPEVDARLFGKSAELWFSAPEGSEQVHLEVVDTDTGSPVVSHDLTPDGRFTLAPLPAPGNYAWRMATSAPIRTADGGASTGIERGPFGEPRAFRVLAVPDPVKPDDPALQDDSIGFSWAETANAARYRFQLAYDREFESMLVEQTVEQTSVRVDKPDAGEYFFRIQGISAEGVEGPADAVYRIEVPNEDYWQLLLPAALILLVL
ncbi:MAG: FecR domain-containing protein [Gammaproteobacteria bacterium]|nr:FecR domain-containing protein [Gammaproteobacteria bacterium]